MENKVRRVHFVGPHILGDTIKDITLPTVTLGHVLTSDQALKINH